jgi:hypothetical protein
MMLLVAQFSLCCPKRNLHFISCRLEQGRINGFVDPRHLTSLGPFGDSRSIFGNTVYSRLSGPMEEMHG